MLKLIKRLVAQEDTLREAPFLAPCVSGAHIKTRIDGLVYDFAPDPRDFEGWGLFLPLDNRTAGLLEEADLPLRANYLARLPALTLILVRPLARQSWLAVPLNRSDARQRVGFDHPVLVRLVEQGYQLDRIIARFDGATFWYDELDRRADPVQSHGLRQWVDSSLAELTEPGLSPEWRHATQLARDLETAPEFKRAWGLSPEGEPLHADRTKERRRSRWRHTNRTRKPQHKLLPERQRLEEALQSAGGKLVAYHDRGHFYWVEWSTADGRLHQSAIARGDLTVITAGLCLDGMDSAFDLQSLVGVVDGAEEW